MGDASIDHAAGLPLDARSSWPPPADWAVQPRSRAWSETPNVGQPMPRQGWTFPDDSPVDLPMRSVSKTVIIGVAVFLAFVAVVISVFFAGFSRTILVTDVGPSESSPSRGERVLATTPAAKETRAPGTSTAKAPTASSAIPNVH